MENRRERDWVKGGRFLPYALVRYNQKISLRPTVRPCMSTTETSNLSSEKTLEAMKNFAETYAKRTDTYFCAEPSVTAVVIEGLAKHKDELGAPLCPCRHYEDKEAEVKVAYWNCPCIPMRERKECHCMLFLTPDNDFAGTNQDISMEQLQTVRNSM